MVRTPVTFGVERQKVSVVANKGPHRRQLGPELVSAALFLERSGGSKKAREIYSSQYMEPEFQATNALPPLGMPRPPTAFG